MSDFDAVFAEWWALLCERFGAERSQEVALFYRDALQGQLTATELAEAMSRVAYGNTFFPSPREIVEAVKVSGSRRAADEWDKVVAWVIGRDAEAVRALNEEARRIADSMGLLDFVGDFPADKLWLRRQFMAEYTDAEPAPAPLKAIGPAREQKRISDSDAA